MRTFAFSLLIFVSSLMASDLPLTVEDSGSKEVDAFVLQLVSNRTAPHASGYTGLSVEEDMAVPYMTSQVSNALVKLKGMGTAAFPALIKHLRDDRYSYSTIVAAWDNCTVGDAVLDVLSDGHSMVPGYKFRKTPSGSAPYLSFKDYLRERDPAKWASWASKQSRLQIQLDFIDWCAAKERKRGFIDKTQQEGVLALYAAAREEAAKENSEPHHAADWSQPVSLVTNREPSAAGSNR